MLGILQLWTPPNDDLNDLTRERFENWQNLLKQSFSEKQMPWGPRGTRIQHIQPPKHGAYHWSGEMSRHWKAPSSALDARLETSWVLDHMMPRVSNLAIWVFHSTSSWLDSWNLHWRFTGCLQISHHQIWSDQIDINWLKWSQVWSVFSHPILGEECCSGRTGATEAVQVVTGRHVEWEILVGNIFLKPGQIQMYLKFFRICWRVH